MTTEQLFEHLEEIVRPLSEQDRAAFAGHLLSQCTLSEDNRTRFKLSAGEKWLIKDLETEDMIIKLRGKVAQLTAACEMVVKQHDEFQCRDPITGYVPIASAEPWYDSGLTLCREALKMEKDEIVFNQILPLIEDLNDLETAALAGRILATCDRTLDDRNKFRETVGRLWVDDLQYIK